MSRDSSSNLVADPTKFPNGMKNLANKIHGMGLKFGLCGDSGTKTCSGYPGSQDYETQGSSSLLRWASITGRTITAILQVGTRSRGMQR